MSAATIVATQEQFKSTPPARPSRIPVKFASLGRSRPQAVRRGAGRGSGRPKHWHGLLQIGKDPVAVGSPGDRERRGTVRQKRPHGRQHDLRPRRRDGDHRRARARCGFSIVSLDSGDKFLSLPSSRGTWPDQLAGANRITPAFEAASRVVSESGPACPPETKRRIAGLLNEAHEGVVAAAGPIAGEGLPGAEPVGGERQAAWAPTRRSSPESSGSCRRAAGVAMAAASWIPGPGEERLRSGTVTIPDREGDPDAGPRP